MTNADDHLVYGIMNARSREVIRDNMTLQFAEDWIKEFEEDGGRPGAFMIVRRSITPWQTVTGANVHDVIPYSKNELVRRIEMFEPTDPYHTDNYDTYNYDSYMAAIHRVINLLEGKIDTWRSPNPDTLSKKR